MQSETGPLLFFQGLFSDGHVSVSTSEKATPEQIRESVAFIHGFHPQMAMHIARQPPEIDDLALSWATEMFYRAAQLMVYRELGPEIVESDLSLPLPMAQSAKVIYSVDLVFRFLPDLLRIAVAASEDDPLIKHLRRWADEFPLSSIGVPNVEANEISLILTNSCLKRLYVDRVISWEDLPRLANPDVREDVQACLGLHPALSPTISKELLKFPNLETEESA